MNANMVLTMYYAHTQNAADMIKVLAGATVRFKFSNYLHAVKRLH